MKSTDRQELSHALKALRASVAQGTPGRAREALVAIVELLGAGRAGLFEFSPEEQALYVVAHINYPLKPEGKTGPIPLGADMPMNEALRRGQPVVIASPVEYANEHRRFVALYQKQVSNAVICLPILTETRTAVVAVGFDHPLTEDAEPVTTLLELAEACSFQPRPPPAPELHVV